MPDRVQPETCWVVARRYKQAWRGWWIIPSTLRYTKREAIQAYKDQFSGEDVEGNKVWRHGYKNGYLQARRVRIMAEEQK